MAGRVVVGTSSWADPGFVEEWYPPGMPARNRLGWYAEHFEAVEVNSTFYAIPDAGAVARWAQVTPPGFTFDVKLHKALSRHSAALDSLPRDMRDSVETGGRGRVRLTPDVEAELARRTLEAIEPLVAAGKMSAFLLQLTPAFSPHERELDEIAGLIEALRPHTVALELRNRGWVGETRAQSTLEWLEEHGVAWVAVDAPPGDHVPIMPALDAVTHPKLAYIRMHGRNTEGYLTGKTVAERFAWDYSDDELKEIAGRVDSMAEGAGEVHVMFNNNRGADAPSAAMRYRILMGQTDRPPPATGPRQLELG